MEKIKVGVIGTGFIGTVHVETLRRLGFVEVIAIAEHSQALAEQKAQELHIPLAYGNIDELLNNPDIQVVHNCTPNHLHGEINKKIITAGKHVFSEKPLCMDSSEADELLALAQQYQVVHGVSFVYRHFAMVQQAASMRLNGELGRIFAVYGHYLQDWLLFDTDYNWRIEPEIGGLSRAVADIGSHWCDTAQFMTGKKIVSVFADLMIAHPMRKVGQTQKTFSSVIEEQNFISKEVMTEDYATVLVRFDDGTKGSFTVSQVSAGHKNDLVINVDGSLKSLNWQQQIPQYLKIGYRQQSNQILCDDPGLVNSEVRGSVHYPGGHIEGWGDAFKNMLSKFYRFIAEGKSLIETSANFATFAEGAQIVHIVDAILRSAEQERWINVQE